MDPKIVDCLVGSVEAGSLFYLPVPHFNQWRAFPVARWEQINDSLAFWTIPEAKHNDDIHRFEFLQAKLSGPRVVAFFDEGEKMKGFLTTEPQQREELSLVQEATLFQDRLRADVRFKQVWNRFFYGAVRSKLLPNDAIDDSPEWSR